MHRLARPAGRGGSSARERRHAQIAPPPLTARHTRGGAGVAELASDRPRSRRRPGSVSARRGPTKQPSMTGRCRCDWSTAVARCHPPPVDEPEFASAVRVSVPLDDGDGYDQRCQCHRGGEREYVVASAPDSAWGGRDRCSRRRLLRDRDGRAPHPGGRCAQRCGRRAEPRRGRDRAEGSC